MTNTTLTREAFIEDVTPEIEFAFRHVLEHGAQGYDITRTNDGNTDSTPHPIAHDNARFWVIDRDAIGSGGEQWTAAQYLEFYGDEMYAAYLGAAE